MIDERALLAVLLFVVEQSKAEHDVVSRLTDEVSALRETVRALDPAFSDVFEKQREEQSSAGLRQIAKQQFDGIIRGLKATC